MNELEKRVANAANALNGWISVNDLLPEKYGEYLCSTKARPYGWVVVYAPVGWICSDDYPVTHWQYLPEPPK